MIFLIILGWGLLILWTIAISFTAAIMTFTAGVFAGKIGGESVFFIIAAVLLWVLVIYTCPFAITFGV